MTARLRQCFTSLVAVAAALGAAEPSKAAFSIGLGQTVTGTAPSGSAAWLAATFEQQDADTVRLTLDSRLQSATEYVSKWFFNLNPSLSAKSLHFDLVSLGNVGTAPKITLANNGINAGAGSGNFDIRFNFSDSNRNGGADRFRAGSEVVYDISLAGGLTENDFNFGSDKSKLSPPPISDAHVNGISDGRHSGELVNSAPAPTGLVLIASGLPLALLARRLCRSRPVVG